ncbi:hypothetical protein [Actinomadura parmotrematis]|uniref:Uncharacterized protein n=1 Tax=Actinomadura parmotrematis TaxID=2864039 RepID=A0ABS7G1L3_9ACTN|nr:hypothetical protein [Actinomadura parmotrematis]MBW8485543.1 hypothetical protein [Actinomadura parmotrematis]
MTDNNDDGLAPAILYVGRLRYDAGTRCLYYQPDMSGPEKAPVWPKGTEPVVRDGKHGVRVPSLGELLEGTWFNTGAGRGLASAPSKEARTCIPKGGTIAFSDDFHYGR